MNADLQIANDCLSARLNKVCDAVKQAVVCTICSGYSNKTYSLRGCGHHFCLPCLFKVFTSKLESRFVKRSVPRTTDERDQVWREVRNLKRVGLEDRGVAPAAADAHAIQWATRVFTYRCPICREHVMNAPHEVFSGRALCEAFKACIYPQMPEEDKPVEVEDIALEEFAPLFMTAEAVVQEVAH
ncbi:hypothetical protein ONZ45_g17088 [Pleurotus djamor]|nr:hypothetical protein ONZ45_g17088 [Pleurotus djamor]